jgi:hypothetical protein
MIPALCQDWSSDLHLHGGPLDPEAGDWTACELCGEEIDAGRIRCERCAFGSHESRADPAARPSLGIYPPSSPGVSSKENEHEHARY